MKYASVLALLIVVNAQAVLQTPKQSIEGSSPNNVGDSAEVKKKSDETSAKSLEAATRYEVPVWTVSPAAETQPAFRYEFWPHASRLKPGKAQLYYFRAVAALQQADGALESILAIARQDEFATSEVRAFLKSLTPVFDHLERMAFCEDTSWDHGNPELTGVKLLEAGVDDCQLARDLVRLLVYKAAIQRADRDFDGVSRTVLIGNRLAYLLGRGESVIQRQIACALSANIRIVVQETIQTPGCPNLYWAIATVPQPLIDLRPAVEQNLKAIHKVFPELKAATTAEWSEETSLNKWKACLARLAELYLPMEVQTRWIKEAKDCSSFADAARKRLLNNGFSDDRLNRMPMTTIVMADAAFELDRLIDQARKATLLPYGTMRMLQQLESSGFRDAVLFQAERTTTTAPKSVATLFAGSLILSIRQLEAAVSRTPIMLRRLMTLEAIREYSDANNGQLPASFEDLNMLPVMNAFGTEQPFEYSVQQTSEGPIGVLTGDIPNFPATRQLKFKIAQE